MAIRNVACLMILGMAGLVSRAAATPIAEVLAIPASEVDRGVRAEIEGVITFRNFLDDLHTIVVQDETGGAWVEIVGDAPLSAVESLGIGTRVRVAGQLDRGGFAPRILADQVDVLGMATLPMPKEADINRLFIGADNGLRVGLTGIVQGFRAEDDLWSLVIDVSSRRMVVRIPHPLLTVAPATLVDAEVRCIGVIGSLRNTRGQFLRPIMNVARSEDISVVAPAAASAFEAPFVPLPELALFQPEPLRGRRIRSEGTVTLAYPGRFFYLQDGLHGVRVESRSTTAIRPGDNVAVAGFPDMSRHIGGLVEAEYRMVTPGDRPLPIAIQPQDIIAVNERSRRIGEIARPGNYHGCLIAFTATLMEVRPPVGDWCGLTLSDGAFVLTASLPATEYPRLETLRSGSRLQLTGIADLDIVPDETISIGVDPLTQRVGVFVQSAADIAVVQTPSWWTPARLGLALTATLGAILLVLAWNYFLHKQVATQAASLAEEMRSRYEAEAEFQATLRERSRLATNLHDTVLQTVTGIGYQLKGMRVSLKRGSGNTGLPSADLDIAQKMVDHAVHQLRGTVWAMQTLPLAGQSLARALEALVQRLQAEQPASIRLLTKGAVEPVPELVSGNLFLVAQEAVYNAIRHAAAGRIDVELSFEQAGMVTVRVRDDGCGFLPGTQAGVVDGHFGIEGMRDRMSRIGGTWSLESRVGGGTEIAASVPLATDRAISTEAFENDRHPEPAR